MRTETAIERFLASPALSDSTRRAYGVDVREFCAWLARRGTKLESVDVRTLADYAAELGRARPRKLAPTTVGRKLASVRSFLRFTLGAAHVPDVSFAPKRPRRLPDAPKVDEVNASLSAVEGDEPLALRNRALLELVYSAGLRSREAVDLDLADVDFEQEQVHVRGKGGKERVVPLGEEAAHRLALYLRDARPQLPLDHADVQPRRRGAPAQGLRPGSSPVLMRFGEIKRFDGSFQTDARAKPAS